MTTRSKRSLVWKKLRFKSEKQFHFHFKYTTDPSKFYNLYNNVLQMLLII